MNHILSVEAFDYQSFKTSSFVAASFPVTRGTKRLEAVTTITPKGFSHTMFVVKCNGTEVYATNNLFTAIKKYNSIQEHQCEPAV